MSEKIIKVDGVKRYKEEFGIYAMYVIGTRVSADYRDGLKQVHRRTINGMVRVNAINSLVKSARVVGETLKEHPHGDSSVYDAMKNMTNFFDIYVPLIEGHGAWGSIDGDSQAAMRYTEAKLSKFTMDNFIKDVKECPNITDWVPTFDNQGKEPVCLPSRCPILLINGSYGIGVGMRSTISKHNINKVIDATLKLLDNPNIDVCIPPDQCLPCDIINTDWKTIANTGHGNYKVRGRMNIVEVTFDMVPDKKYLGCPALEIISTPDLVTLNNVKEKIKELVDKKTLPQIIELSSDKRKGEFEMSCLIILKKGSDAKYVMDMIYKHTEMQHTFTENLAVLYNYNTEVWSQRQYLLHWLEYDKLRLTRKYYNSLQALRSKESVKDAYVKCCVSDKQIDKIIKVIRGQKKIDDNACVEWLISNIGLTTAQAKYIINAPLKNLSMGYLDKYKSDLLEIRNQIKIYESKIINEELLKQDIRDELIEIKEKYGKKTNCRYIDASVINEIPQGEFKLAITEKNFIKKVPVNDNIGSLKDDRVVQLLKVENTESIFIFDNIGKVYKLPIHKIPISDKGTNGIDIRLLIKKLTANITTVIYEPLLKTLIKKKHKHFIVVQSKLGNIKKMDIEDILGATVGGLVFAKCVANDYINDVIICANGLDIISYSDNKALRYNISEVPHLMRNSIGNKTMKCDCVDGLVALTPNMTDIIVITEKGYINRFDSLGLLQSNRAKAGSNVIKLTKGDNIKYIYGVDSSCIIDITTSDDKLNINVENIKIQSSISTGTRLIKGNILHAMIHHKN